MTGDPWFNPGNKLVVEDLHGFGCSPTKQKDLAVWHRARISRKQLNGLVISCFVIKHR